MSGRHSIVAGPAYFEVHGRFDRTVIVTDTFLEKYALAQASIGIQIDEVVCLC